MCVNNKLMEFFTMDDTNVDEIIDICPIISSGILSRIENFYGDTELIEQRCKACYINSCETLKQCAVVLESQKEINNKLEENIFENATYIAKIQSNVEELTKQKNLLRGEVTDKEAKKHALDVKHLKLEKKKKQLLEKRDKILVCKLSTNTNFSYLQSTVVSGYSFNPETQNIKPFEFDTGKYQKEEIVNFLYENLAAVSSRQISDDVD